jgi:hypothetical protein
MQIVLPELDLQQLSVTQSDDRLLPDDTRKVHLDHVSRSEAVAVAQLECDAYPVVRFGLVAARGSDQHDQILA